MVTLRQIYNTMPDGKPVAEYAGMASDTRPVGCANGSDYIVMDTGKVEFYDETNDTWIEF